MQREPAPQPDASTGMQVARFMATPAGRIGRVALGVILIVIGVTAIDSSWKYLLEALGIVPILTAAFNVSILARLLGAPFRARDL